MWGVACRGSLLNPWKCSLYSWSIITPKTAVELHFIGTYVPPQIFANIISVFCSLVFILYTAKCKIYLHIGKAQQTVKYIHPKEPHVRIRHAETGYCHMEIADQPQVPKQQIPTETVLSLEYVCINYSQNNSEY